MKQTIGDNLKNITSEGVKNLKPSGFLKLATNFLVITNEDLEDRRKSEYICISLDRLISNLKNMVPELNTLLEDLHKIAMEYLITYIKPETSLSVWFSWQEGNSIDYQFKEMQLHRFDCMILIAEMLESEGN